MSVEKLTRKNGSTSWKVRWRDPATGANRGKTFDRKRDADAWDAKVRDLKRLGEVGLYEAGRETLSSFGQEWLRLYVIPKLAPKTTRGYVTYWDLYILPALGHLRLRDITPQRIDELLADLSHLSPSTQRKVIAILQSCLQRGVEWGRIPNNAAKLVRKPPKGRSRQVQLLSPDTIERMRAIFLARGRLRDATVISVLGYCGLRPGELRGLTWAHIGERTIHVEQAISLDRVEPTKTRRGRTVPLPPPVARDLAEWRLASPFSKSDHWVFPGHDNTRHVGNKFGVLVDKPWSDNGFSSWATEVFKPVATELGLPKAVPYDLRHSAVSLWIHDGLSILQVARQAGHSATMTLEVYGHVFDEFDPEQRISAAEAIRQAREKYVPGSYPRRRAESG